MMILPEMKQWQQGEGTFLLPEEIRFSVAPQHEKKAAALIGYFLPGAKVSAVQKNAHITAVEEPQKQHEEEYRLTVAENGIHIAYCTYRGLRNALAALATMAYACEEGFRLEETVAEDYPVARYRGVMLDLARGIKPIEILKADIILIAKSRMNVLHLHLADSKGVSVKLDCIPESILLENCYSKAQMAEIVELADVLALDIIPEFDMPAHSKRIVANMPELGCDVDGTEENTGWTTCPGTEETYRFYERIIQELVALFPGEYFHIGGDELEFRNEAQMRIRQLCHWNYCRKCRKKMEEEHLENRQELFHYFILRIHEMVKKAGRKMVMWSDQIDCNKPAVLPTDILMQFWRVAGKGNGPRENCSLNNQLKMGYTVVNSHYPETYVDIESYMSDKTIWNWRWDLRPETDAVYADKIIGSEICAWEYGNRARYTHYDRSLASCIVVMADKLWSGNTLTFDAEYEVALTKAILGTVTPKGLNIFRCIGSVLPPRADNYAYWERITCAKEEVAETLAQLERLKPADQGQAFRLEAYSDMLRKVLEQWQDNKQA